jgi:hypothetical protein
MRAERKIEHRLRANVARIRIVADRVEQLHAPRHAGITSDDWLCRERRTLPLPAARLLQKIV